MSASPGNPQSSIADAPSPIIAREGWPIVAAFLVVSAALTAGAIWISRVIWVGGWWGVWGAWGVGLVCGALCLWCIWFFRDPQRRIPGAQPGRGEPVVCPADGVVCFVGPGTPPAELGLSEAATRGMTRVSVFMNVFNVHVNRSPVDGRVVKKNYRPGKFFNASFDKASEHNERMSLVIRMNDGRELVCVQIAGLVARRIVCRVKEGDRLTPGGRFGLIRFGSRVDVYLPAGVDPAVRVGEASVAGESVLAWMSAAGAGAASGAAGGRAMSAAGSAAMAERA